MRALSILMLVEGYNAVGGIAEIVDSIAVELIRRGHRVGIISTFDRNAHDNHYERSARAGVECTYLEIPDRRPFTLRHLERFLRPSFYTRQRELIHLMRRWRPDVVNSQPLRMGPLPQRAERVPRSGCGDGPELSRIGSARARATRRKRTRGVASRGRADRGLCRHARFLCANASRGARRPGHYRRSRSQHREQRRAYLQRRPLYPVGRTAAARAQGLRPSDRGVCANRRRLSAGRDS